MDLGLQTHDVITIAVVALGAAVQWGVHRASLAGLTRDVNEHDTALKEIRTFLGELRSDVRAMTLSSSGQTEWRTATDRQLQDTRDEVLKLREWRHEMAGWAQRVGDKIFLIDARMVGLPQAAPRERSAFDAPG